MTGRLVVAKKMQSLDRPHSQGHTGVKKFNITSSTTTHTSSTPNSHRDTMDRLLRNLKQRVPIRCLQLPEQIDTERLLTTLSSIANHNPHYVKTFFSACLFKDPNVDQDEYYELFSEVIMSKPKLATDLDQIEYTIQDTTIQIRESPRLISGAGTTGQRTWEAALYFTEYLLTQKLDDLKGKHILELGTGTGLVPLALIKKMADQYASLTMTDGDSSLIDALSYNFQINGISMEKLNNVSCQSLWWGQDQPPQADIVIAADVTYDSRVIPSLVECISQALNQGTQEAWIAATIRSENTIKTLEDEADKRGLVWSVVAKCERPGDLQGDLWYSDTNPEFRVYEIKKPL